MQTDTVAAWQVEKGDLITLGSDTTFEVKEVDDDGLDGVSFTLADDEGLCETFYFTADEDITIVVSLDDPDEDEVDSES